MIKDFDNLISSGIHLVDFYADWCGPCKVMSQILESIKDEVDIIKINTDLNPKLVFKYRIMSIPTIIIFKDGKILKEIVGLIAEDELKEVINKIKEGN